MEEQKVGADPKLEVSTETKAKEEPKTYSAEDYGKIQRQLQDFQRRNRELQRQQAEGSKEAAAAAKRSEDAVGGLIAVLAETPTFSGQAEKLGSLAETLKSRREKDTTVAEYVKQAAEFVEERGLDWYGDSRLEDARKLWDSGKLAEAMQAAYKAIPTATLDEEEINRRAEALYQTRMKEANRVDIGSTTAGAGLRISKPEDWNKIVPGSAEEDEAITAGIAALKARQR